MEMMYWQCREEATGPAERGRTSPAQKQAQNNKSSSLQDPDTEAGGREHRDQKQAQNSKSSGSRYRSWRQRTQSSETGSKQ